VASFVEVGLCASAILEASGAATIVVATAFVKRRLDVRADDVVDPLDCFLDFIFGIS
jgi:hypothetical protein